MPFFFAGPTITEDENRPCQTPQSILKVKKLIQTDEKKGVPNASSKSKEENLGEDFQSQKESARSESRMSRESTPGKSLRFEFLFLYFLLLITIGPKTDHKAYLESKS